MRTMRLPPTIASRWSLAAALLGAILIGGCSSASTGSFSGTPAIIKVTGQTDISAQVATDAGPFVFTVTDTGGTGVPGVTVNFTIVGPATLLAATVVTDKGGSVVTSVHFGQAVGNVAITATAVGITTPAVVHTSSYAAPASNMTTGGSGQTAPHGTALLDPLSVLVTDQYGNPVSSIPVTMTASAGVLDTPSGRTGSDGRVTSSYTLPATAGPQTITATATINNVLTAVTFSVTGT